MDKRKKETNTKKKNKNKVLLKILLTLIIVFVIIFIILLCYQLGYFNDIKRNINPPKLLVIPPDCALIMGRLIDKMTSNDYCKQMCTNRCETSDMFYYKSEFIKRENSCNLCNCYCK